jgi:hypothetical protein
MEELTKKELFTQVRVAHRMLAAYYQRIFQLLTDVTGDERLGLNFYVWLPAETDRPCKLTTNVFDRSAWDLLPGLNTSYLFHTADDSNKQNPGEWLLDLCVIGDTGIFSNDTLDFHADALGINTSPENSTSVLRCFLYAPHERTSLNWYKGIWDNIAYQDCVDAPECKQLDEKNAIYGNGFEIPLEELTGEGAAELLVNKIISFRDAILPVVEK